MWHREGGGVVILRCRRCEYAGKMTGMPLYSLGATRCPVCGGYETKGEVEFSDEAYDEGALCSIAFAGVPRPMLAQLAKTAFENRCPGDLRGLLLAALAEPEDAAVLGALRDWIEERQPRSDLPETWRIGEVVVRLNEPKPVEWWIGWSLPDRCGVTAYMVYHLSSQQARDGGYFSMADVLDMTTEQVVGIHGVGPETMRLLKRLLSNQGLYLRGDKPIPGTT